jgi:hypothetical protein
MTLILLIATLTQSRSAFAQLSGAQCLRNHKRGDAIAGAERGPLFLFFI